MLSRILAGSTVALALLAGPAAAQAATRIVSMGPPQSAQKQLGKINADANAFFPNTTTIAVGDKVKFVPSGFHTVDIPATGQSALPLIVPGAAIAGAVDAAGAPFWFNGQAALGFNPVLAASSLFGKKATFDGSKRVDSGLPLANKPKPLTVTFKTAGTFTYFCDVHAGMKATLKVLAKRHKIPPASVGEHATKAQVAAALSTAKAAAKTTPPADTVSVGVSGTGGVEVFGFFPSTLSVSAGTTVTFAMSAASFEVHTATTGPGNPLKEPASYLGKIAASLNSPVFDQSAVYPSDVPPGPASLTPTSHGNGFWSSGAMDEASATPLGSSSKVTFSAAGTYEFYCMIHPFMHGTVKVK